MFPATQMKAGMIIVFNGELYRVTDVNHVTPGKGRGMVQAKLYSIKDESYIDNRFRSDEQVEKAYVERKNMEYLYQDENHYIFMDTETYEQIRVGEGLLGSAIKYLKPNIQVQMDFFEGRPVNVELPLSVELEIVETEPPMKGATASGSAKPATLENGVVVKVPQFLQVGEKIRVDTRDDSFIERV